MRAISIFTFDSGISTVSCSAPCALRMRASMSAIGSVMDMSSPLPARLGDTGHLATVGELPEAQAAQRELAEIRARVEAAEVPEPGQGNRQQAVEELPHPVPPERHLGADRHALAQLEAGDRAPGLRHHRLLAGDDPQLVHCIVEGLGFLDGLADAHVDHDLHDPRDRHDVQPRLGDKLGADLIEVTALEARFVARAVRGLGGGAGCHQPSSPSHERQTRIFVPSSPRENPTPLVPQVPQTSVTLDRATGSSLVMIPPSCPPPRAEGRTFSWRFTRLTPSTGTRFLAGRTAITRPSLPASLPDRTGTRSPFRMRAAISGHRREDGHAER